AKLAGELKELLHRLVDEPLELRQLALELGRVRVLHQGLEAKQDRGERLVDLVVEVTRDALALLLLRAEHEPTAAAALGLDALEEADEGGGEAIDLLHLTGRRRIERDALRGVDALETVDQLFERGEAAAQHHDVRQQGEHDRHREERELPALALDAQVEIG